MTENQIKRPIAELINKNNTLYIVDFPAMFGRNNNTVDLYFFHESISREHCLFEVINHRVTVRDMGSTIGTKIDGVKLEPNVPYNINDGAKLTIGKIKFVFHVNYNELSSRERASAGARAGVLEAAANPKGSEAEMSNRGSRNKRISLSAKELQKYEYDESEIIFVECGLSAERKPISYTSEIKKETIESEIQKAKGEDDEDIKKTQILNADDVAEALEDLNVENLMEDTGHIEDEEETNTSCLRLIWIDDESGDTKRLKIDRFPFYIGRKSDENDYAIKKQGMSRKHMHFEENDGKIYICDDNSTNGVKLNGTKIDAGKNVELTTGDKIRAAGITFVVNII